MNMKLTNYLQKKLIYIKIFKVEFTGVQISKYLGEIFIFLKINIGDIN